jgi:hypothetical protein
MKTIQSAPFDKTHARILVTIIVMLLVLAYAMPVLASSAEVTGGAFHTFAAGVGRGYNISGHAHMTRTADGRTIVSTHATGLAANTVYGVHVHNKACGDANGGGHYQNVVGGTVDPYNEIWPLFTTNAAGVGNGKAVHAYTARPEAQAVVIHDTDGARIACTDLR